jgi:hypothetical protein
MEVVAKDSHESGNIAQGQLIEMAALLMEDGANNLGRFETPVSVAMGSECAQSIKMTVSYTNQGRENLATRMVDRRTALLNLLSV